jgi:hypothetical protein
VAVKSCNAIVKILVMAGEKLSERLGWMMTWMGEQLVEALSKHPCRYHTIVS